ncbi:hypothetical protein [Streptomyces sp. NPDC001880]
MAGVPAWVLSLLGAVLVVVAAVLLVRRSRRLRTVPSAAAGVR